MARQPGWYKGCLAEQATGAQIQPVSILGQAVQPEMDPCTPPPPRREPSSLCKGHELLIQPGAAQASFQKGYLCLILTKTPYKLLMALNSSLIQFKIQHHQITENRE